jgi:tetratricopeptide (TPR) repeat protein
MGMLGVALAAKGSFADAEPLLRAGLEENPLQPFVHAALAHLLRLRGATEEAETHFLEEIQLQPLALQSRRQLVEIYAEQQRYEEQLQQLAALERVESPNRMTAHSSAQALFNLERFVEAHARVQECRRLAPRYPGCALLEANVLKKLGKDAEALAAFEAAKELARAADLPVGD